MTRARMPRPHEVAAARRDPRLLRAFQERDQDQAWRTRGVCRSVDPEVFFPAPSEPADAAVALCRTCDVQGACLAWALEVGDCHGVWGATTPRERRAMLVAWRSGESEPAPAYQTQSFSTQYQNAYASASSYQAALFATAGQRSYPSLAPLERVDAIALTTAGVGIYPLPGP
jgi:WhiB family transcriptional regulator, redox-sensing transcriptional regulator